MSKYFNLQNAPVLTTPSDLIPPKITTIGYPGDDTAADPAGGQTITLTGAGFKTGASVIINGNTVGVVTVVSSTSMTFVSPALSAGSYVMYVVNSDGGTAIAIPGIQYSGTPTWSTAAGSLGSYTETTSISNTVIATGDTPISYSLFSGTLPTGATLNTASGLISGSSPLAASPTTYTFTIRATDAQQQDTNRQFSLTINPDVVTWSSPANGTTYSSTANSAISNVSLSAVATSGQDIVYTANALPTGLSISGNNITGTPTQVGSSSTLLTATANTTNVSAIRVINWVISVAADTYFPYVTSLLSANTPASTFVTDGSTNSFNLTVNGDTKPSNFGPYTPGYYSNFFDGTGDYLSILDSDAFNFTGDFTIEAWIYPQGSAAFQRIYNQYDNEQNQIIFRRTNTNALSFVVISATTTLVSVTTSNTLNVGAWNHVAVVRSGNVFTLYINGVSGGSSTASITIPNLAANILISTYDGTNEAFNGYISNMRVVKGTAVYTSTFTPSTTPLTAIANTSLLTCQSNRFIDNSTNNFAITRNGDTKIDSFDPFLPDSSYAGRGSGYFDGTGDYLTTPTDAAFDFWAGNFTFECWFYPTGNLNNSVLFSTGSSTTGVQIYFGNNIGIYTNQAGGSTLISGTAPPLNVWAHIALTKSGSTFALFLNGARVGTSTSTAYPTGNQSAFIGANSANAGQVVAGYISNARLVKGTAVYDPNVATLTVPTTPLTAIANTSLLTLQNNQPNINNMFLDNSSGNFNITRNGSPTQGSFSPYGGGWSNFFNGSGDFLTLPSSSAFSMGTGDFTIEAWIYTTSSATQRIVSSTGNNFEFLLVNTGSNVYLNWYDGVGDTGTGVNYVTQNSWVHVAVSRSGTALRIFINGVVSGSSTNSVSLPASPTLYIGRYGASGVNLFSGYISNLRILKGTALYTSNFTPSTAPLTPIVNTSLLTCADNRFIDESANNFAITRNGDTSIQRFNPFNPVITTPTSYSAYFDGTGDGLTITATGVGPVGTQDYTVEFWMYASSLGGNAPRLFEGQGDVGQFQIYLSNGTLYLANAGFNNWLSYNITSLTNQWLHICLTRSGSALRLFVNGVLQSYTTSNVSFSDAGSWIVLNSGGGIIGYQSNLRIVKGSVISTYNTAVTTTGTTVFTPPTTPLTAVSGTSLLTLQSSTLIDNSTNNYTITGSGNISPRQFNPFGWTTTTGSSAAYTPALYGGSAYFDGTGDYLSSAYNAAYNLGTGDYTLECWFYVTAGLGGTPMLMGMAAGTNSTRSFYLYISATNFPTFGYYSDGTNVTNLVSSTAITGATWNHIAIARTNGTTRMFLNGTQVGSTASQNAALYTNASSLFEVGREAAFNGSYFTGYISDVRIIKGVARYTSNFVPPVEPLTALQNTVLLTNMTGAGIYDSAMMANYETLGNASISTSIKKYGNSSLYFDGTGDYLATPINPGLIFTTVNFTVECWVYIAGNSAQNGSTQRTATLCSCIAGSPSNAGWGFGILGDATTTGTGLFFENRINTSTSYSISATVSVSQSSWNHVAVVRNGTTTTLYLNGVSVGSGTLTSQSITSASPLWIGRQNVTSYTHDLNGYIDDLRITRGVARYTSTFSPTATPFIPYGVQ